MVARVLLEMSHDGAFPRDWRRHITGAACIGSAVAMQVWASRMRLDPDVFHLGTIFFICLLAAGIWLLSIAQGADLLVTRAAVTSRASLAEKTLSQLLKVEGSIAHKLLGQKL